MAFVIAQPVRQHTCQCGAVVGYYDNEVQEIQRKPGQYCTNLLYDIYQAITCPHCRQLSYLSQRPIRSVVRDGGYR
jgi:hypothetical protein